MKFLQLIWLLIIWCSTLCVSDSSAQTAQTEEETKAEDRRIRDLDAICGPADEKFDKTNMAQAEDLYWGYVTAVEKDATLDDDSKKYRLGYAYYRLAQCNAALGKMDKAESFYRLSMKYGGGNAGVEHLDPFKALVELYTTQRRAEPLVKLYLDGSENNTCTNPNLWSCDTHEDDIEKISKSNSWRELYIEFCREFLTRFEQKPQAPQGQCDMFRRTIGSWLIGEKRYAEALPYLQKALVHKDYDWDWESYTEVPEQLILCYEGLGETEKANKLKSAIAARVTARQAREQETQKLIDKALSSDYFARLAPAEKARETQGVLNLYRHYLPTKDDEFRGLLGDCRAAIKSGDIQVATQKLEQARALRRIYAFSDADGTAERCKEIDRDIAEAKAKASTIEVH